MEYDWELALGKTSLTEAEFSELARLKVPLVQVRGEWMELRPEEIEAAIEFFKKNRTGEMTLAEALRLCSNLQGLSLPGDWSSLPVHDVRAEDQIEDMLMALSDPCGKIALVKPPREFKGSLRPYQLRGVTWRLSTSASSAWARAWPTTWGWERRSS